MGRCLAVFEAEKVRCVLRDYHPIGMKPSALVCVLQVLFTIEYGVFRPLTCPMYGLSREMLVQECTSGMRIRRALSVFAEFAFYKFFDFGDVEIQPIRQQVLLEIDGVKNGTADHVISNVMGWIKQVQYRAIRDHAVCDGLKFTRAWTTVHFKDWASEHWATCLRSREDRDIGWIPGMERLPPPSP